MAYSPTAKEIQELRARTGAGITDCRNALVESSGDVSKAVEILRKRGIAKAEKRGRFGADRLAALAMTLGGRPTFVLAAAGLQGIDARFEPVEQSDRLVLLRVLPQRG